MGRRDRERKERIRAGLGNPIARQITRRTAYSGVVDELSKGTVSDQTSRLSELVGSGVLPERNLKKSIIRNAPKEMDKAIKKFRKRGVVITVDSLLVEVKSEPGFLKMCEGIGLGISWFENLAKERMEANNI